jgi:hypothetical protein
MKKIVRALAVILVGSVMIGSSAKAGPATDALTSCLTDNTTGKDRKDMARWVFVGMSAHPEIQNLSNVTEADREAVDRTIAALFTKLLAEKCPAQAKLAAAEGGSESFRAAFEIIGKLAMQELMSNPKVNTSFSKFTKYVDQNKMNSALSKK